MYALERVDETPRLRVCSCSVWSSRCARERHRNDLEMFADNESRQCDAAGSVMDPWRPLDGLIQRIRTRAGDASNVLETVFHSLLPTETAAWTAA